MEVKNDDWKKKVNQSYKWRKNKEWDERFNKWMKKRIEIWMNIRKRKARIGWTHERRKWLNGSDLTLELIKERINEQRTTNELMNERNKHEKEGKVGRKN